MGDNPVADGCAFGRETRVMIGAVYESLSDLKEAIGLHGGKIDSLIRNNYRKPSWFVAGILLVLSSLCVGLVVYVVTNGHVRGVIPI